MVVGFVGGGVVGGVVEVDVVVGIVVIWMCLFLFGLFGLFRLLFFKECVLFLFCFFCCVFLIFVLMFDKILCVMFCFGLGVFVEWVVECDVWNIWFMNWCYFFGVWCKR